MARRRRSFSVFTFAFLDVMCCGFGAVLLVFLLTRHEAHIEQHPSTEHLDAEVTQLRQEIGATATALASLNANSSEVEQLIAAARAAVAQTGAALAAARAESAPKPAAVTAKDIEELRAALRKLQVEKSELESQLNQQSQQARTFAGAGNREYLTGMKLGGEHILILFDTSASMLDESIVNVLRKRNMDEATKRRSEKWQQALATVDWISARFPARSQYQIYTFNTETRPLVTGTDGSWLNVSDTAQLNHAIADLKLRLPDGGTNLAKAFAVINRMSPRPDNVYLITDGLPTQGTSTSDATTVTGSQRLKYFQEAVAELPRGVPVNTILLPMEGDPMAPSAFWQVALTTRGSFLTPSYDWP